MAETRKIRTN